MSQAMALREYLEDSGHSVDAVLLGTGSPEKVPGYFKEVFSENLRIFRSPWLLRTPNKKGIYVGRTLLYNLLHSAAYLREIARIRKEINAVQPDVIFNFYELIGALAMRNISPGIRRIGVGHHFYLHMNRTDFNLDPLWHRYLLGKHSRMIIKSCDRVLALSFREEEGKEGMQVFPPLIRREFREMHYLPGSSYLVYLLQEGFFYDLVRLARQDPGFSADIFTSLKPEMEIPDGIRLHAYDTKKFIKLMASCKGLISTAGFDSAAEAALHGIPLAVVPSRNHFEQRCNAADIETKGVGVAGSQINPGLLERMFAPDNREYRAWVEQAGELLINVLEK
jgi:uncharacterized protein (TIGR00661 family)